MILALHHVQLAMPKGAEAAMRHFYSELLGLREVVKPEPLASRGGCWFGAAGFELHLGVEEGFCPARKAHPAFLVDELEPLRQHLESAAVPCTLDTALVDVERFFCHDPFGNRLEFIQFGNHDGLRATKPLE